MKAIDWVKVRWVAIFAFGRFVRGAPHRQCLHSADGALMSTWGIFVDNPDGSEDCIEVFGSEELAQAYLRPAGMSWTGAGGLPLHPRVAVVAPASPRLEELEQAAAEAVAGWIWDVGEGTIRPMHRLQELVQPHRLRALYEKLSTADAQGDD